MKKFLLLFPLLLVADFRQNQIQAIDTIIDTYKHRLTCLQTQEAAACIDRFPLDNKSDALAKTFAMSFPKAFYMSKLKRDIEILERQKLCYGKAPNAMEAKKCLKP